MPTSLSTIRCRIDAELDAALFAYQERLGDQLIAIRSRLEALQAEGEALSSSVIDPLKTNLDYVLASADTSTTELMDSLLMVDPSSPSDLESTLGDRFDLTIVNGRYILPGTKDVSSIQLFARVLGGFEELYSVLPDLAEIPITDDSDSRTYSTVLGISTRMVMVVTYLKVTTTPATSCTAEIVVTEEITVGVDISLSQASAISDVPVENLRIYIFWLGSPEATERNRSKARVLELTNAQFVDAVSLTSRENFIVSVIRDPADIPRLSGAFGDDAGDVVSRVTGPIEFFPSSEDIASSIRDSLRKSPGSVGPSGFSDLSSPGVSVLSVIDVDSTFGLSKLAASLTYSLSSLAGDAAAFAEALSNSIQSQIQVLTSAIEEAQQVVAEVLGNITNLMSLVQSLFNDISNGLLDCVFGSSFSLESFSSVGIPSSPGGIGGVGGLGSPGVPGASTSNPLDSVLSLVEGQSSVINSYISSVSGLVGSLSDLSCGSSFVDSSALLQPSGPIRCQIDQSINDGFELPSLFEEVMGTTKVVMDILTSLFDGVRADLRSLKISIRSMSLSLRQSLDRRNSSFSAGSLPSPPGSPGCAPPEASRLASLLAQRAIAGFTEGI